MENLISLIGTSCNFVQGYFFFKTVSCLLKPREPRFLQILAWMLCTLVSSVVIFAQDPVNILVVLCLFFGTTFFFEGPWYLKISAVMILYPIATALNFLLNNIGTWIFFTFWGGMGFTNLLFSNLADIVPLLFWFVFYRSMNRRLLSKTLTAFSASALTVLQNWMTLPCVPSLLTL